MRPQFDLGHDEQHGQILHVVLEQRPLVGVRRDDDAGLKRAANLFALAERDKREHAMREAIREVSQALRTLGKPDAWSPRLKATDDFLDPLFRAFFAKLGLPLSFRKSDYHVLARLLPKAKIDPEIVQKMDAIVEVANRATPRTD